MKWNDNFKLAKAKTQFQRFFLVFLKFYYSTAFSKIVVVFVVVVFAVVVVLVDAFFGQQPRKGQ